MFCKQTRPEEYKGEYSLSVIPLEDGMKVPEGGGRVVNVPLDGKIVRCYVEESGTLHRRVPQVENLRQLSLESLFEGKSFQATISC